LVCALLLSFALLGSSVTTAHADDLDKKKAALDAQLKKSAAELADASAQVRAAVLALQKAQGELAIAKDKLADTKKQLAAAQKTDDEMAKKLADAQTELTQASQAVTDGEANIAAQQAKVGLVVRTQYQQQTNLLGLAIFTDTATTAELATKLQWSTTLFDVTQTEMAQLQSLQTQLQADKSRKALIAAQLTTDRQAAADHLAQTKKLAAQAADDEKAVEAAVATAAKAKTAADKQLAAEKAQNAEITKQRDAVTKQIKARIAKEKAAAAKAAAAKAAKNKAAANTSSNGRAARHGFIFPVVAPITSPFGMRYHPIYHIWELHDGTDFGAWCGTPILAPYSGVVTQRYWNTALGNRLIIDQGKVDGHYITTSMNHAERYIVSVGQHVSQGQVVGYVGTTGTGSTGCHLHFMMWEDGNLINPMSWL